MVEQNQSNKNAFHEWLSEQHYLTIPYNTIVTSLDEGSCYAIDHGLLKTVIWQINDAQEVENAFLKILAPYSWFRMTHRKRKVADLESAIAYYQRFLRERQQGTASSAIGIIAQDAEMTIDMRQGNEEETDSVENNNVRAGASESIESAGTSDQAGTSKAKMINEQSKSESEDEQKNDGTVKCSDDEIRQKDPELYDLVYYVLLKLQREQPKGALFIDIYDQIGRSFTEIKKILWTASWVEQQGKRFLLKPGAVLHQQLVSNDGGEGENKSDSVVTESQTADEETETSDTEAIRETTEITEKADSETPTASSTLKNTAESAQDELSDEQNDEDDDDCLFEEDDDVADGQMSLMDLLQTEEEDATLEDEEGLADRLYALLKSISDKNKFGTTLYFLATTVRESQATVKAVLDGADWAKCEYNRYKFNYEAVEDEMKYDFIKPQSLAFTKPISLTYFEETVVRPSSWRQLFIEFMRLMNEDYPHYIKDLKGIVFSGNSVPLVADKGSAAKMWNPKEFADGLYIETNRSAKDIMINIRRVLDACYVDYENVVILYTSKSQNESTSTAIPSPEKQSTEKSSKVTLEDAIYSVLSEAPEPLTVQEICDRIEYDTAYHFTAKDPSYFLRMKMEMGCKGSGYLNQDDRAIYGTLEEFGKKKYYLLSQEDETLRNRIRAALQEKGLLRTVKKGGVIQKTPFPFIRTEADAILAEKFPVLFKRLYSVMKDFGKKDVTAREVLDQSGKVARVSTVKQILDYASWTLQVGTDRYRYSSVPIQCSIPKELQTPQTVVIEKKTKPEKSPVQKSNVPVRKVETNPQQESARAIVTEDGFFSYMRNVKRLAENSCKGYVSAVRTSQKHAFQRGLSPWKIFDADSLTAITVVQALMQDKSFIALNRTQNNRFIIALEKLKDYIGAELSDDKGTPPPAAEPKKDNESTSMPTFDKERYIKVLMQRYRNGMMFDSIDYDNFRDTYEMLFDETLDVEDAVLEKQLRSCGVVYMDRLFPVEGIIDNQTREKLYQYIESSFSSGKQVLYYKAIFADLASDFASCYVLRDADMLRAYLEFTAEPGQYFFFEDYMAKERSVKIDHNAEIADRLLTEGKPMKIDDLCAALSHIPSDQIRRIITTDKQFVWNAKGEYFHRDIFEVTDEELEQIAGIIDYYIAENGYVIWTDVWHDIKAQMPGFIENNLYLSSYGVREILARRFSRRFSFNAGVISLPKDNLQLWKVYQLFAKHHSTFTADELYNLSRELNSVIYFDSIFEVSVRVSHDLFVSKNQISFDVDAVDKAIESFMSKDYIRIREIDSYLSFPYVGYVWNEYLLESFLLSYSKQFMLLNNGTALNNVVGAIVKRDSSIKEFVDVCAAVLADSSVALKKNEALDYLVGANMITRRSYRYIEEALRKAAQIRGAKG